MTVENRTNEAKDIYERESIEVDDTFSITFPFLEDESNIKVLIRKSDNTRTYLTLGTDYELTDTKDGIKMLTAYNDIKRICIYRAIPLEQSRDFDSPTVFADVTESALDKLTMLEQDRLAAKKRYVRISDDDERDTSSLVLKYAPLRANSLLYQTSDGTIGTGTLENSGSIFKALRQPQGEKADQSFVISEEDRAGNILAFNDNASVEFIPKYTAGDNVQISDQNVISATDTTYTAGENVQISGTTISATDTTYTAGANIDINLSWQTKSTTHRSVCYGNSQIVGVSYMYVSEDVAIQEQYLSFCSYWTGKKNDSWKSISLGNYPFQLVGYGNGRFVALPIVPRSSLSNTYRAAYWYETDTTPNVGITTIPVRASWTSICYGEINGVASFVAVATDAAIYGSGARWTSVTIPSGEWKCVCYGDGKFVAITTTTAAYWMGEGNWNSIDLAGTSSNWNSICYGNGKFVAVSSDGVVAWWSGNENDTWQEIENVPTDNFYSIYFSNNAFIILGKKYVYSWDGETNNEWGIISAAPSTTYGVIHYWKNEYFIFRTRQHILYTTEIFSISATDTTYTPGDNVQISDQNVISATDTTYTAGTNINITNNVISATDTTYTAGDNVDITNNVISATDTTYTAGDNVDITNNVISATDTTYTAGANVDITNNVISATDTTYTAGDNVDITNNVISATDTTYTAGTNVQISGQNVISATDTTYTAGTNINITNNVISATDTTYTAGNNVTINSDNSIDKTDTTYTAGSNITITNNVISATAPAISYTAGKNIIIENGVISVDIFGAKVADVTSWTQCEMSSSLSGWVSVCYGNDKFVAIVYQSRYGAYSTDGINWTQCDLGTSRSWTSVCYGNGKFVAVATTTPSGAYSTDGINWTQCDLGATRYWRSVCYGNGKFVAVVGGSQSTSQYGAYSTDGINWTQCTLGATRYWRSVCYGNGRFVAVAYDSRYGAYSTDGMNWTQCNLSTSLRYWYSVCYGNGRFVAVAYDSQYGAYSGERTLGELIQEKIGG